jgi:hypothetical protein
MKNIRIVLVIASLAVFIQNGYGQNINWQSLDKENTHIFSLNAGYEYGVVFGAAYSHQLKTKLPMLLNIEYSSPAGKKVFDDFKTKVGGQIRVIKIDNFCVSAKINGVFRRLDDPLVKIVNFGSDLSTTVGYYKPKWYVAGEAGFDKAIATHFKHTDLFKEYYAEVKNGWYQPATGGNFYYGLQAGFSFKKMDITLKGGKIITQNFKTTPLIPFYAQLALNLKLNSFNK